MSPPWMPFYPGDYLRDTRRLSTLQHGAYMLLIMEYWLHAGLPDDDRQLARIAGLSDSEWTEVGPVIAVFFTDGWVHQRIEEELAKAKEKNTRRVGAGKAGAAARHAQGKCVGNDTGNAIKPSIAGSNDGSIAQASSSDIQTDISVPSISGPTDLIGDVSDPKRGRRKESRSTKSAIREDAQPSDIDHAYAAKIGMPREVFRAQWGKFRDHHIAKGNRFASWPAAWRTWCAGWLEYGGGNARAGPARYGDGISNTIRQLDEAMNETGDHDGGQRSAAGTTDARYGEPRGQAEQRGRDRWSGATIDLLPVGADRYRA